MKTSPKANYIFFNEWQHSGDGIQSEQLLVIEPGRKYKENQSGQRIWHGPPARGYQRTNRSHMLLLCDETEKCQRIWPLDTLYKECLIFYAV